MNEHDLVDIKIKRYQLSNLEQLIPILEKKGFGPYENGIIDLLDHLLDIGYDIEA